jgi:hypothetical protein
MDPLDPNNLFGISIFGFFIASVATFIFVSYKFMKDTGEKAKKGERVIMWGAVIGVIFVLIYACLAFIFKIII